MRTNDRTTYDAEDHRWWHRATAWGSRPDAPRPYVRAGLIAAPVVAALGSLCLLVAIVVPTAGESQDVGLGRRGGTTGTIAALGVNDNGVDNNEGAFAVAIEVQQG